MLYHKGSLFGSIMTRDAGRGSDISGVTIPAIPLPQILYGLIGGVACNTPSGSTQGGKGGTEKEPHPSPTEKSLTYSTPPPPYGNKRCGIPSGGFTEVGHELDRTPDPICALPCAGHDSGT